MSNLIQFPYEKSKGFIMNQKDIVQRHLITETPESFEYKVTELVWQEDITYLDAVLTLTEDMESETIHALISKPLYKVLEREAKELSLLKAKKQPKLFS